MRRRVTAVEGGRWAESVAAARSTLGNIFKARGTSRRRSRSASGGRGGRYPQGGRGGPGFHQERPPYRSNTGPRYGGPQGTSRMNDRRRVGGSEEWIPDARRAPGQGRGRWDEWGSLDNLGVNVDEGDSRGAPPQPPVEASTGEQRSAAAPGEDGARETGGSFYPPPPPLRPPPPPPPPHLPSGSDWAQEGGRQTPWGGDGHSRGDDGRILENPSHAGVETPYPQPSLPQQQQHQQLLSEQPLPRSGEDDDGDFPRFSEDIPGSGILPSSGVSRLGMASEGAPSASGGLNPKDVEDFYASQQLDHDNGDRDGTDRGERSKGEFDSMLPLRIECRNASTPAAVCLWGIGGPLITFPSSRKNGNHRFCRRAFFFFLFLANPRRDVKHTPPKTAPRAHAHVLFM